MARRQRLWAVLTAAGVLIAVGVPLVWYAQRSPATVGTVGADTAEALASATPAPPATATPSRPGRATPPPAGPAVPTTDGRVGRGGTREAPTPVEVRLPTLGVTAPVGPIGVERDGELEIPEDVRTVGWYRYGPRPGDARGSTLFSGHVDSAEQGQGAFYRLGRLDPGDPVLVRLSDRSTVRYRVVAREEWPKTATPLDRLFARSGAPRLTLVTCGGGFREDISSYTDNIAVTAVPEGGG
jgi:hypothetical protein